MKRITIKAGDVTATAALNDTQTAEAIWAALPIEARGSSWGDEIYFSIPVDLDTERGQEVVQLGDLGYWSPGTAFCRIFGQDDALNLHLLQDDLKGLHEPGNAPGEG
jgi:hypothetical protein